MGAVSVADLCSSVLVFGRAATRSGVVAQERSLCFLVAVGRVCAIMHLFVTSCVFYSVYRQKYSSSRASVVTDTYQLMCYLW